MHTAKSLKNKKSYCIFIQQRKFQKICINMHFNFNNQFIKVTRTRPIFQKFKKNLFCFLLISGVMILYVRHVPDIKIFFVGIRLIRFYPIR
jgi:hypothetical protein